MASALLVACGLAVLAYLVACDWYAQYLADGNISQMTAALDEVPDSEREELGRQAYLYNERMAASVSGDAGAGDAASAGCVLPGGQTGESGTSGPGGGESVAPYDRQLSYRSQPMMAYLEIPRISVKLPVYHGVDEAVLMSGVGHLEGTSLPIGGSSSHSVLLGHSGMHNTRMLDDLPQLALGDLVIVWVLNEAHAYEVYDTEVVLPERVEDSIGIKAGQDLITLITCTPYGVNTHRLLVHGRRCEYVPEMVERAKPLAAVNGRTAPFGLALGAVGVALAAGFAARRRRTRRAGLLECKSIGYPASDAGIAERNGRHETETSKKCRSESPHGKGRALGCLGARARPHGRHCRSGRQ